MVSAGWREPRLSLKCCSRNLPAWSRTQILTFSLVCWCEGVDTCAGGDTSELDPPDRPHLLGWRELNKLDAELSLDLLPGVLGPDFGIGVLADEEDALLELELGVEVDVGPEFTGVFEVPENVQSKNDHQNSRLTCRCLLSCCSTGLSAGLPAGDSLPFQHVRQTHRLAGSLTTPALLAASLS